MKENGIIDLIDLPSKRVRVTLSESCRREIFGEAIKVAGSQQKLSAEIRVPQSYISNYLSGIFSPTLEVIWKIRRYLVNKGRGDIVWILRRPRAIRKLRAGRSPLGINFPHFPINFNNPMGAAFAMAFLGDGHIQRQKMRAEYTSFKSELLRAIIDLSIVLGNVDYYRGERRVIFPSIVGFILHYGLGLPTGNKMESDPRVPLFLFKSSKETIAAALKQIYDDEGSVSPSAIKLRLGKWVPFGQTDYSKPPRLLLDVKLLAESLGISVCEPHLSREFSVNSNTSQVWEMCICSRKNF